MLVAPDGAADYLGRGEGNVWVPAVTAAAMIEGAALYPERAGRYLAVAEAAVARLRALHLTPDRGLLVVPGERESYDGIDSYVHTVAYNGLALWALAVAAERAATLPPAARGEVPAAGRLEVADRRSGLAVVGTGPDLDGGAGGPPRREPRPALRLRAAGAEGARGRRLARSAGAAAAVQGPRSPRRRCSARIRAARGRRPRPA